MLLLEQQDIQTGSHLCIIAKRWNICSIRVSMLPHKNSPAIILKSVCHIKVHVLREDAGEGRSQARTDNAVTDDRRRDFLTRGFFIAATISSSVL